jgi:hypothetical protein
MPKNKIVGKNDRPGSNKATGRDYSYDKKYEKKKQDYRVELNKEARDRGIYGKRASKGVDLSHKKDGSMTIENSHKNRARNGSNGRSTKK